MKSFNINEMPLAQTFTDLVDNLLSEFSAFSGAESTLRPRKGFVPVNIKETADVIQMEVVAPGFEKTDFKVEIDDNLLTISAEKKSTQTDEKAKEIRKEYAYLAFKRTFTLDEKIDATKINASYINGVLMLNLPKKVEVKPEVTEIKIN